MRNKVVNLFRPNFLFISIDRCGTRQIIWIMGCIMILFDSFLLSFFKSDLFYFHSIKSNPMWAKLKPIELRSRYSNVSKSTVTEGSLQGIDNLKLLAIGVWMVKNCELVGLEVWKCVKDPTILRSLCTDHLENTCNSGAKIQTSACHFMFSFTFF